MPSRTRSEKHRFDQSNSATHYRPFMVARYEVPRCCDRFCPSDKIRSCGEALRSRLASQRGVPQFDHRPVVIARLVAKNADGCSVELEPLRLRHGQTNPTCGKHTPEMAMREERNVSVQFSQACN